VSHYAVQEGDSLDVCNNKKKGKEVFEFWFDFYVDRMLPAVAGVKVWSPDIRCCEEVSTSTFDGGKLRITASTEAFTVLVYMNCWKKWNAMYRDEKSHKDRKLPGRWKCPRYNKKRKDEYTDYETPYTDSASGQRRCGGYTREGMMCYLEKLEMVTDNRQGNHESVSLVENECIERLQRKRKKPARKELDDDKKKKEDEDVAFFGRWFVEEVEEV